MSNTPSDAEILALAQQHLKAFSQFTSAGEVWFEGEVEFARAVLAKWGTQQEAWAVPQGWKAVPVNPTPEMWKAAKSVPDPNPPYPPHYGLVWDAMLAASPTPTAEQAAPKTATQQEAQEPVAWLNPWRADQVTTDYDAYGERGIPLYTAPQPAPGCHHRPPCAECAARARLGEKT